MHLNATRTPSLDRPPILDTEHSCFFVVGPNFFYVGLLVLVLGLVRNGLVGSSGPGLAALGLLVVGVSRVVGGGLLTLVGHAVLLAGLAQVGRVMLTWGPRSG